MTTIRALFTTLEFTKQDVTTKELVDEDSGIKSHTNSVHAAQQFDKLKAALTAQGAKFYTFTPKELKPKCFIIKGIRGFTEAEIKEEIEAMKLDGVTIIGLTKCSFDKRRPEIHHHLIQVTSDSPTSQLLKIPALSYQRVTWERLRKPLVYQCRKCQRTGHASSNCHLQFRCVKCAKNPWPG